MKWYKPLCLLFCIFLFQQNLPAQSTKTIHQTFTLDGAQKVNVSVVGSQIEMRETKGSRVLVEMTVKISLPNDRLLDFVINNGRYELVKTLDQTTGELTISSKKTNNVLMIKGKECYEELSYVIYVPASVKFANNSTIEKGGGE